MSNEIILSKTYELLKETITTVNKFPRSFKFTLADRIQNILSNVLEQLIEAYYTSKKYKLGILKRVNISLEQLRYYFRLAFELGLYNSTRYHYFSEKVNEIGRMLGGWIRSLK
ncbi:MAG: diversity-generating retroelement protein Avd [Saprospiraceae bacterium]